MIYHIVDAAEIEGRDCIEDFEKINEELRKSVKNQQIKSKQLLLIKWI